MKVKVFLTTLFFFFVLSISVFGIAKAGMEYDYAGSYAVPEHMSGFSGEEYERRAGKKLERGLKNFFLGFLEVPHGVKTEIAYREREYLPTGIETFFIGAFKGTMKGVGRMGVGLYETFTFPYAQGPIIQEMDEWLY